MQTRRQILAAIDRFEPSIAAAFREAIAGIRSRAQISELARALEDGDMLRAARAAGLNQAAWATITEATRSTFAGGGAFLATDAPVSLGFLFDMNNERAEDWLRNHSSQFVTAVNADQVASIQAVAEAGTIAGRNPRSTALDIVGRIDRATGRRTGGIVGLTRQQSGFVTNMRAELASGDPERMANYFSRSRRDRRFDGVVRRAIAAEKPVGSKDINRLAGRYSDRLLQTRGNNIARSEALQGFNAGSDEAIRQAVDSGIINQEGLVRTWDASGDNRVRDQHSSGGLDGQVRGFDEPFLAPDGSNLMFPGDSSRGATAANIINCRCAVINNIDWIAQAAAA